MTEKPDDRYDAEREARMTDSNIDLHTVDVLLNKADALLSRHKKPPPSPVEEDIPVLTDIDDDTQMEMIDAESLPPLAEDDEDYLFRPQPAAQAVPPPPTASAPPPVAASAPAMSPAASAVSAPTPAEAQGADLTPILEQLIDLETTISRQIETWFNNELSQTIDLELHQLSQKIDAELNRLSLKLREELLAQMRTTLQPKISEQISENLAQIFSQDKSS